jgi:hypothetical protein
VHQADPLAVQTVKKGSHDGVAAAYAAVVLLGLL